jgi:hypothetical protein
VLAVDCESSASASAPKRNPPPRVLPSFRGGVPPLAAAEEPVKTAAQLREEAMAELRKVAQVRLVESIYPIWRSLIPNTASELVKAHYFRSSFLTVAGDEAPAARAAAQAAAAGRCVLKEQL